MQLHDAIPLSLETSFEPWLVACVQISRDDAHQILSFPHYTETHPFRTAGGHEDHWAFRFPCGMHIGILLRVPYNEADIYADPPNSQIALDYMQPLIANRDTRVAEPPVLRK